MFLTVILVWIGLSLLAAVLVLAAVIRTGQVDQFAEGHRDEPPLHANPSSKKAHESPTQTAGRYAPGGLGALEEDWGVPVQASHFSSDRPSDKI